MNTQKLLIILFLSSLNFGCKSKISTIESSQSTFSDKMKLEYVGVAAENKGMHVWGSSPVIDKDGKVHLFAAQWPMATQKDFSGWFKDCEIGHYVSDSPEGPFKYVGIAVEDKNGLFNAPHNPTISYIDGKYVLNFIVNENNKLKTQRIIMYVADDLNGTWRPAKGAETDGTILRRPLDTTKWNYTAVLGVSNPSLIKFKDKYMLYHKSVIPRKGRGGAYTYGVAVADKLEGPYVIHPEKVTPPNMALEDAFAYTVKDSVYMMSRDFGSTLGNSGGGLLWRSADGFTFPKENTKRAYEDLAHYLGKETLEKGTAYRGKKDGHLERAQVLMIDGIPAYLYLATGVQVKDGYGSSSHVFKIIFE
ncbi:glycoside hydrolase family protein [Lutibacter sp. A64]|uniref:glycoside hydrolase family protein n=1 Tax=Lutibacter sp. A64 TaxID=2918526 RepID=UPI001F0615D0|nr:glycoside hydrolase family protein [Lutibacter sp. A64]UMB53764.1 glycoside hydrolase family protein [Lutibacter sp. A64]